MSRRAPGRHRRLAFEELGSTNARALETAVAGDPGPLWITAERQVSGRGRRGRTWESPAGNLYASLLLLDPAPMTHLPNLPLVAAVGIRDGLSRLPGLGEGRLALKWPNDILAGGAKCVGILIESERLSSGQLAVVIGCGVNVEWMPPEAPYKVTSLRREGVEEDLGAVFDTLAAGLEQALVRWDRGAGFARMREEWLAVSVGRGERCTVNLPDRSEHGRFVDLDAGGRLILERDDGTRVAHSAGDLFFADLLPQAARSARG